MAQKFPSLVKDTYFRFKKLKTLNGINWKTIRPGDIIPKLLITKGRNTILKAARVTALSDAGAPRREWRCHGSWGAAGWEERTARSGLSLTTCVTQEGGAPRTPQRTTPREPVTGHLLWKKGFREPFRPWGNVSKVNWELHEWRMNKKSQRLSKYNMLHLHSSCLK